MASRRKRYERYLSGTELARIGEALRTAAAIKPAHAAATRLILLTGCRKSEIIALRWSEVKGRRLLLADSKTGARTVWLGVEARAVIDLQPRRQGTEYVFDFGTENHRHRLDEFWRGLRAKAGLSGVRLHDLRHSYASFAAQRSETLPMIGKLLGHKKLTSAARYAHLDDAAGLAAVEQIAKKIVRHSSSQSSSRTSR